MKPSNLTRQINDGLNVNLQKWGSPPLGPATQRVNAKYQYTLLSKITTYTHLYMYISLIVQIWQGHHLDFLRLEKSAITFVEEWNNSITWLAYRSCAIMSYESFVGLWVEYDKETENMYTIWRNMLTKQNI